MARPSSCAADPAAPAARSRRTRTTSGTAFTAVATTGTPALIASIERARQPLVPAGQGEHVERGQQLARRRRGGRAGRNRSVEAALATAVEQLLAQRPVADPDAPHVVRRRSWRARRPSPPAPSGSRCGRPCRPAGRPAGRPSRRRASPRAAVPCVVPAIVDGRRDRADPFRHGEPAPDRLGRHARCRPRGTRRCAGRAAARSARTRPRRQAGWNSWNGKPWNVCTIRGTPARTRGHPAERAGLGAVRVHDVVVALAAAAGSACAAPAGPAAARSAVPERATRATSSPAAYASASRSPSGRVLDRVGPGDAPRRVSDRCSPVTSGARRSPW